MSVSSRRGRGEVECRPIAEAVLKSGVSRAEIARRLGWSKSKPDTWRVSRMLGLVEGQDGYGRRYQEFMDYDNAVKICQAADIDPVDVGL